jgi:hypothetical protein
MLSARSAVAQAFADPTVNAWSVVESGPRRGVAIMSFGEDRSLSMLQVLTPNSRLVTAVVTPPPATTEDNGSDGRGNTGDATRNGGTSTNSTPPPVTPTPTNSLPANTNIFGWVSFPFDDSPVVTYGDGSQLSIHDGVPSGEWDFDINGKLIGFWTEISLPTALTTNQEVIGFHFDPIANTNVPTYRTNVSLVRLTNAVSFTAKLATAADPNNSRLTLLAYTPAGRALFSALPATVALTNLSGTGLDDWYAFRTTQLITFTEFFDMMPNESAPPEWNVYDVVNGRGPGYAFDGAFLLTRQKTVGYVVSRADPASLDQVLIRSVVGSVDLRRRRFSGNGWEGTSGHTLVPTQLRAFHDPTLP